MGPIPSRGSTIDSELHSCYNIGMTNICAYEKCNEGTNNPKYCSLSCAGRQGALDRSRTRIPRTRLCAREDCTTEFVLTYGTYANKFCSHRCSAIVSNARRADLVYCLQCGKRLRSGKLYCSQTCGITYRRTETIRKWLAGEWGGNTQSGLASSIRNYLIQQAGYKCQSPTCCVPGGWGAINPKLKISCLEIEHIDGNCHNNVPTNLIVLCPNCHSLTPTYKALNKGSGRAYRGKYDQYARVDNSPVV